MKANSTAKSTTNSTANTKMLILTAIFTAVNVVCAQIQIPLAPVPISLATFAIFLTAGLLGCKYGSLSLIVYVLLGAVGVPVFAGFSGGFGIIAGPTGGYIIGYIFNAFITGLIIDRCRTVPSYPVLAVAMILGLAACYLLGTVWFIHLTGWTLSKALMTCVIVFLPGDALKIALASILVKKLYPSAHAFRLSR